MTALKFADAELPFQRSSTYQQRTHLTSGEAKGNGNGLHRFSVRENEEWPRIVDSWFGPDPGPFYYVFDFDGVISSETEEQIYRLPARKGERELLEKIAVHYHISPEGYDTRYLRHLVVQELLLAQDIPIEPGPLTNAAKELSRVGRTFFLLTARSGRAAVMRALTFLDFHEIRPQELFFVGRAAKGRQLSLIRTSVGGGSLIYFDDSPRHARNSRRLLVRDFETVFVDWPKKPTQAAASELYENCISWFTSSVDKSLGALRGKAKRRRPEGP